MRCTGTDLVPKEIIGQLFNVERPCCFIADNGYTLCYRHRFLAENAPPIDSQAFPDSGNVPTE